MQQPPFIIFPPVGTTWHMYIYIDEPPTDACKITSNDVIEVTSGSVLCKYPSTCYVWCVFLQRPEFSDLCKKVDHIPFHITKYSCLLNHILVRKDYNYLVLIYRSHFNVMLHIDLLLLPDLFYPFCALSELLP